MITGIFQNAPIWVWPLLLVLIGVGVMSSRERSTKSWVLYVLPVLGILAINAVARLPAQNWIWGVFGLAYLCGAYGGFRFQQRIVLDKSAGSVRLAGEWLTLLVLMVIFSMNFAAGMTADVSPDLYGSPNFHIVFACVEGLASGSFLGRALWVYRAPGT